MTETAPILLVMGSVRAGRRCPQIAHWVARRMAEEAGLALEVVDLAAWPLPADDEAAIPATGVYAQGHSLAWSRKIAGARGFVFLMPQYNGGYPAPLKNAIDHLYKEWAGKPAVVVSYGGHGGGRGAAQLRQVLEFVKAKPVATMPAITLSHEAVMGGPVDPDADFSEALEPLRQAARELAAALAETAAGTPAA